MAREIPRLLMTTKAVLLLSAMVAVIGTVGCASTEPPATGSPREAPSDPAYGWQATYGLPELRYSGYQ
jgi:hypothetical protein